MYKAQLVARLGILSSGQASQPSANTAVPVVQRWTSCRIEETSLHPVPYEITLDFPRFLPDEGELAELNVVLHAAALSRQHAFRRESLSEPPPSDAWWANMPSSLYESFEVSLLTEDLISVKYSYSIYGSGAAHPNHFTRTLNYQRGPLVPLDLRDVLDGPKAPVDAISKYCQADLARQKEIRAPDEWIQSGAGPGIENFHAFSILGRGLLFTFDHYQVGAYAEGPYQVYVPSSELTPFLSRRTKVPSLWNSNAA
jgi:hypothetical protein